MKKYLHIPAKDGESVRLITIPDNIDNEVSIMQEVVGGHFALVPLFTNEINAYCSDTGLIDGLPINGRFQQFVSTLPAKVTFGMACPIVGDVLITGGTDADGNAMTIPQDVVDAMGVADSAKGSVQ